MDTVIRRAFVLPGEGPGFTGDVAVADGRIVAVAHQLPDVTGALVVDGEGLLLCPGFIDMHAHTALESFRNPWLEPKVAQGFTTELIHPDGLAPAPVSLQGVEARRAYLRALEGEGPTRWDWSSFAKYLDALHATRPVTTLIPSAGHNAIRDFVMGGEQRAPTLDELKEMQYQVRLALEAGARALSFGLIYFPGVFSNFEELTALAEVAAEFEVPLVPHVRNEGDQILSAVMEMIQVARKSGAALHLSHLKVVGNARWVEPLLELIDKARRDVDITFDQYPYGAGSTILTALLPPWAQEGGPEKILSRLEDLQIRRRMGSDMERGLTGWENLYGACGPEKIYIASAGNNREKDIGSSLAEIAERLGEDPVQVVMDLLADTQLNVTMVDHYASEETVRAIFGHPAALVGTDGIFGVHPHPRLYGTAARVLGRYALRENLISVEQAVARLTAKAADRLRLRDRGRIQPGLRADLVLLDPARFVDTASYEKPKQTPPGVALVMVDGQIVRKDGKRTEARPGGVLGL